ncbi:MAG: DUF2141 domain-containing protein [Bacteroidales bacterium]|nr:DUF2141 domain-containing protein [Bacteroidales bacterium]MDT8432895.1 DUF2141 domain-containing protein [Bacteroidales bacterium]
MNISRSVTSSAKRLIIIILTGLLSAGAFAQSPYFTTGKLIITFSGIRSDVGQIALGLYDAADQWTDDPKYEFTWTKEDMKNGRITVVIDSLPRTTYACAVLDDENENLAMDYWLGLPTEGWGMSANPSFLKLKKPEFEEVSFDLDAAAVRFEINIHYIRKNKKVG